MVTQAELALYVSQMVYGILRSKSYMYVEEYHIE